MTSLLQQLGFDSSTPKKPPLPQRPSPKSDGLRLRHPWLCGVPLACVDDSGNCRCCKRGDSSAAEVLPLDSMSCDLECVVHKVSIQRMWRRPPMFGWLTGYQDTLQVELAEVGSATSSSRMTSPASMITSTSVKGGKEVVEEWAWNSTTPVAFAAAAVSSSHGAQQTAAQYRELTALTFNVTMSTNIKLRVLVRSAEKAGAVEPAPLEPLGEGRFRIAEDVMAAAQVVTPSNLGRSWEIPIVRDGRIYGHVSISVSLRLGPGVSAGGNWRPPAAIQRPPHAIQQQALGAPPAMLAQFGSPLAADSVASSSTSWFSPSTGGSSSSWFGGWFQSADKDTVKTGVAASGPSAFPLAMSKGKGKGKGAPQPPVSVNDDIADVF